MAAKWGVLVDGDTFDVCLTVIKKHVSKYCTTVYERNGKNLFQSI